MYKSFLLFRERMGKMKIIKSGEYNLLKQLAKTNTNYRTQVKMVEAEKKRLKL